MVLIDPVLTMRVAAVQTTAGPEPAKNLEAAGGLVEEAASLGAELVVLPEYFSVAGRPAALRELAESLEGPTVTWARDLARRLGIHLVAGSFPERRPLGPVGSEAPSPTRLSNTSCLIDPTGAVTAVYRKVHLFDAELERFTVRESDTFAPGSSLCTAPLSDPVDGSGRAPSIGLSLCYDIRFPEQYLAMALEGATVMVVPAAFTASTGPAHWELLLRARAVENQVFVIGAGQEGTVSGMGLCHGHSMIIDPWGTVLAERTDPGPGIVVADLDFTLQRKVRKSYPTLAHRRPKVYR